MGLPMDEVFLLWHVHECSDGSDDETLIGVYLTQDDARAAIERVGKQPRFAGYPQGFQICPHRLNRDSWSEGSVSLPEVEAE
jgi:hypothetical protein